MERHKQNTISTRAKNTNTEFVDNVITEAEHIHNKVIFDCINEAFDELRPYGKSGEPKVWNK